MIGKARISWVVKIRMHKRVGYLNSNLLVNHIFKSFQRANSVPEYPFADLDFDSLDSEQFLLEFHTLFDMQTYVCI